MKRIKFIARTLLILFVGLVVGFNLYSWNARSLTGNELPMPMGYGAALVLTGSMEPTIMADDLILVSAHESYDAGDIVVYQSGRILVVHRILRMEENAIITKGDANQAEDEPVAPEQIKGKVIAVIHRLDDVEDKWVVAPENVTLTEEYIRKQVDFQEQYFTSEIYMREV